MVLRSRNQWTEWPIKVWKEGNYELASAGCHVVGEVGCKWMLLKRGAGNGKITKGNNQRFGNEVTGRARVQVRFCSHWSFSRSPCSCYASPCCVLVINFFFSYLMQTFRVLFRVNTWIDVWLFLTDSFIFNASLKNHSKLRSIFHLYQWFCKCSVLHLKELKDLYYHFQEWGSSFEFWCVVRVFGEAGWGIKIFHSKGNPTGSKQTFLSS